MTRKKPTSEQLPEEEEFQKEGYEKVEEFVTGNRNIIVGVLVVAALAIGGYFAYTNLVLNPKELEAQDKIVKAESFFQQDSLQKALYGDGFEPGFLQIADKYGKTPTGKLAHYYAGICMLRTGEFDQAITHLKKYHSEDNLLSAQAIGGIGHAYSETGKFNEAISQYRKAAAVAADELLSPYYLQLSGELNLQMEKWAEAKKDFEKLQNDHPETDQGRQAEKYIALAEENMS